MLALYNLVLKSKTKGIMHTCIVSSSEEEAKQDTSINLARCFNNHDCIIVSCDIVEVYDNKKD